MAQVLNIKQAVKNPEIESILNQFPNLLSEKQPIIIVLNQTPNSSIKKVSKFNYKRFRSKAFDTWENASKILAVIFILYILSVIVK